MTPIRAIIVLIALAIAGYALFALDVVYPEKVDDFATCVAAGNPVMESYPRQCRDEKTGSLYVENVANQNNNDKIRVVAPVAGQGITSPVTVTGEAVGTWYFEASFPVQVLDGNGNVIGQGPAQAKGEWMTTEFVPFEAAISFTKPATATGTVRFMRDNPSGLPENDARVDVPVTFSAAGATSTGPVSAGGCKISGCSSQICAEEEMMSTCEYREVYMCYKSARCERQATGKCGWTETPELRSCLRSNS